MDSLTQIVLGAATGELILGRKLGNRAMIWGGVAGTIPDLDVFISIFVSPTTNLHVHRGLSHSLFFLTALSFLMAWLTFKLYPEGKNLRSSKWYKTIAIAFRVIFTLVMTFLLDFMFYFFIDYQWVKWILIALVSMLSIWYIIRMYKDYNKDFYSFEHISYKSWTIFFIFTLLTHPLLDCFTVYGTQIFSPFTNMRVSWDNISVVDPVYTFALGLPIWLASFFHRTSTTRFKLLILGVVLSSLYMMGTIYSKNKINKVLQDTITQKNIPAERSMTNPTIFNSILWSATVQAKDSIYTGLYSLMDRESKFELVGYPINNHLLQQIPSQDYTLQTIKWFSKGYYTVQQLEGDTLQINDLRYGTFGNRGGNEDEFIFKFKIYKDHDNNWQIDNKSQRPPNDNPRELFTNLFKRMMGKK
ncbi:MAG TPA: metal-dependent hydrolase [Saprospiraceae bacterium]|nr:metal-dependent hydrolase [Saprospiraceae bacterium]